MILPEITPAFILISALVSFFACAFSTMAGGGAGMILLPILLMFDLPYVNALASHKMAVGFIGLGSTYQYAKHHLIDWKTGLWGALLSTPFVILGTQFAEVTQGTNMKALLGMVILLMTVFTIFKKKSVVHCPKAATFSRILLLSLLLAPVAFYNGWISAGSGFFVTLIYIYVFGYSYLQAVAMMMFANGILWNGISAATHVALGHVIWPLAPGLIIGAILGSYTGAHVAIKKGNDFVRILFLGTSFLLAFLLIWSYVKDFYQL